MSSSFILRARVRALFIVLFCVTFLGLASFWAVSQRATTRSDAAARRNSSTRLSLSDKGIITPAANTITVNSLSDAANGTDGLCTLREAITAANNNAASGAVAGECAAGSSSGSDTIDLTALSGTINLTGALPDITSAMTITGPGSSQLAVKRNTSDFYRILNITSGVVSLSGLTVRDGKMAVPNQGGLNGLGDGGGIQNLGSLTLTDVTVTGNQTGDPSISSSAAYGAGIANKGTLTMINSSVTANSTGNGPSNSGVGGGIYNRFNGTLTMTNCLVSGNTTDTGSASAQNGSGGGIFSEGLMTLTNTTVINNTVGFQAVGGGIAIAGTATLVNCTVSGNRSPFTGAINNAGSTTIVGSTISANTGGGIQSNGPVKLTNTTVSGHQNDFGISINGGSLAMSNCTVTGNFTGVQSSNNGSATMRNDIIALNSFDVAVGPFTSQGHNLIGKGTSAFVSVPSDQVGTSGSPIDPHIGPLANNGGPTQTHALLSNSTAIDAGDDCVVQASHCGDSNTIQLTTDQRGTGFSRQVDGPDGDATATVDIGAYEMQTPLANLPDTSTNEDTQLIVAFDGGDTSTITSVTATSSNGTLIPNDPAHLGVAITGSTGVVTINPAANLSGTTNITVTINRTGGPESKTFMLTVNPVNDGPSFTTGSDQTVLEDSGAQTVNNWATNISPGPSDEAGQTVSFNITGNTNASLFSAGPAVSSTGTLTYTPAANANGSATITINLMDNGGTANGGADTSAAKTFVITVTPVNDAPTFTKGPDKTVNEDSADQFFSPWATAISAGPANESSQTLTFQVTNNTNPGLFAVAPSFNSTGDLGFRPATNANGSATITIVLKDNGGTANGGADTSAPQTFTINVTSLNDAPSFTKGPSQTVNEDAGAQTVNNWATAISPGPSNESSQAVSFIITNNTNPSLFSVAPAVSPTGTLTYTPAADANGLAQVDVALKDDGGTANGGSDTSLSQTFVVTVNAVNDPPSFTKGADQAVNNNAGAQTVANWATNISRGPANESSQTVAFQVTGNTNPGLFTSGPAVSSTGTLTYTPSASGGGTATITINLKDSGGTANGGVDTSASQTFTITVTPVGGSVNFASASSNTTENSGSTTVNVTRSGDTSKAVTVNYASNADAGLPCSTATGVASPKCDFTAAVGTLNFAAGETSKPITILISQDSFVEGPETITLTLSNPTGGAALGTPGSMTVTIADDATEPPTNIIDDPNMFVRMHYHDFLNREADQGGLNFWTGQMTNCGSSDLTVCRVNVSGAFFLSIEFQQTGYLVERIYKTAYGDATSTSTLGGSHAVLVPILRANEFLADTQSIGRGVVVLQPGWEQVLENNKQAYALQFVQSSRFTTALPTTMSPQQFVDKLNQNAGLVLSPSERTTAINAFGIAADTTNVNARAQVLRQIAEDQDLYNAEFNRAFVLTEFFGYLRRNPNDLPDSDYTGYEFWLSKLNQFNGDYVAAEMVKAFIASSEYRQRFGS
jgi:CSLREA domain-containing protein